MTDSKKRILLIYPPSRAMNRNDICQKPSGAFWGTLCLPPTDLLYLASIAESSGFEVKIADYSLGGDYEKDLREFNPDYLLVNVSTPTFKSDIEAVTIAKEICPGIVTIAKGAAFLTLAQDIMYFVRDIDYIIYGEAEDTFRELIIGVAPYRIKGLYYRDDIRVRYTGQCEFMDNLDNLPLPARHLIDNNLYKRPDNGEVQAVIEVSRGCPYSCCFCLSSSVNGTRVRKRSPQNIIEEITECVNVYGIKNFIFQCETFDADKKWAVDLCQAIIDSGLNIVWTTNVRADLADEETAEVMSKAGCQIVSIGAESGAYDVIENLGKSVTLDDVRYAVKTFKKYGVRVHSSFIIGLPWDTEETIEDTVDFAIETDCDFADFNFLAPFPGTKLYAYAKENKLIDSDTSFKNAYFYPAIRTFEMSKDKLYEAYKKAVKRFYLRPTYIFKTLIKIKSKTELKNYVDAGIKIFKLR